MYEESDQLSGLLSSAEEFCIANDRMLYAPFLRAAEEWCTRHECAIGNAHMYVINKPNRDSFIIDIFAAYALSTARELATELMNVHSPHVDVRTLGVLTVLRNAELHIKVAERVIVRVYGAPAYKKINMIALMGVIPRDGLFARVKVPCLPPEIHLCALYRILYSPSKFSEWEAAFTNLDIFWEGITENTLAEKTRAVTGGADKDWRGMYAAIAGVCTGEEAPVIIGDIAIKRLLNTGFNKRLQIICAANIDKIVAALAPIYGRKIVAIKYPLGLPMDFQTSKYTIYAADKIPLCDVFNSSSFEIIPHEVAGGIKYAAPFVLLRFKLIDYWLHRVIAKLTAGISIASTIEVIILLRNWTKERTVKELFEDWKYTGYSLNPAVAKKRLAAELSDALFPVYYPAKNQSNDDKDQQD